MKSFILSLLIALLVSLPLSAAENPKVKFETTLGDFEVVLFADKAPKTVENFVRYVNGAFYDGLIFHRVVKGFMIQGGGYDVKGVEKTTLDPIINESSVLLTNKHWTLAMARNEDIHSATSQFFINTSNNKKLNGSKKKPGYAVFGRVTKGINTIKAIEKTDVSPDMYLGKHRPVDDVIILKARVIKPTIKK